MAVPRSDHGAAMRRTIVQNLVIGLAARRPGGAAGFWIMHRVTRDVRRLSDTTHLLARGRSPERLFRGRRDALGMIGAMEDFRTAC